MGEGRRGGGRKEVEQRKIYSTIKTTKNNNDISEQEIQRSDTIYRTPIISESDFYLSNCSKQPMWPVWPMKI